MNQVYHFILQGKGGVGKTLTSTFIAQFERTKTAFVFCADTDPVNDSFSRYKALNVQSINILNQKNEIDSRAFDSLFEQLLEHDGPAVIDNGASTFIPLSAYLVDNGIIEMLQGAGKTVYIHTILTGGQAMDDTVNGFFSIIKNHNVKIVVWQNEFFGEVIKNGKRFTDLKIYADNKDRIQGIITIPQRNAATYGKDIELMTSNALTFDEVAISDLFTAIPRNRIKTIRNDIFQQLEAAGL
jgi:hypothetical protein